MIFRRKGRLLGLILLSMAMGYLESAVVIYLRGITESSGFQFPFVSITSDLLFTELCREAATLVILLSVGYLAGRYIKERFAWFIFCFAIWDISYYLFLKFLMNWPESLMTWDILFLIPVIWVSPVIAPLIISVLMIILSMVLVESSQRPIERKVRNYSILFLIAGTLLVFFSMIWEYSMHMLMNNSMISWFKSPFGDTLIDLSQGYVPGHFKWILFIPGIAMMMAGILLLYSGYREKEPVMIAGTKP